MAFAIRKFFGSHSHSIPQSVNQFDKYSYTALPICEMYKRDKRRGDGTLCATSLFFQIYSFTAPAEILLMMYLENTANTIKIGITEIATAR